MRRETGLESTRSWKQAITIKLLRTEVTIPKKKLRNQFSYIHALQQQQEKQTNKQKTNKPKI